MKSIKNIQHILERKSFPDFLKALHYKVDLKEWSETGGVFNLCRCLLHSFSPTVVYDVGSGRRPTLGTLMALNYKTKVVCIDPQLDTTCASEISRLQLHKVPLSEYLRTTFVEDGFDSEAPTLILANHSHVSKREARALIQKLKDWVYITVPCCVDNKLSNRSCVSYKDMHMHSARNDIFIYASNPGYIAGLL